MGSVEILVKDNLCVTINSDWELHHPVSSIEQNCVNSYWSQSTKDCVWKEQTNKYEVLSRLSVSYSRNSPVSSAMIAYVFSVALVVFFLYQFIKKLQVGNPEKRPIVISGCDTGFGHLLALKLVAQGYPVYAGCLTEKVSDRSVVRQNKVDALLGRGKLARRSKEQERGSVSSHLLTRCRQR